MRFIDSISSIHTSHVSGPGHQAVPPKSFAFLGTFTYVPIWPTKLCGRLLRINAYFYTTVRPQLLQHRRQSVTMGQLRAISSTGRMSKTDKINVVSKALRA